MYSTNGRLNVSKTTANSIVKSVNTLVCGDCGYEKIGESKEFGEKYVCSKCGSENVSFCTKEVEE